MMYRAQICHSHVFLENIRYRLLIDQFDLSLKKCYPSLKKSKDREISLAWRQIASIADDVIMRSQLISLRNATAKRVSVFQPMRAFRENSRRLMAFFSSFKFASCRSRGTDDKYECSYVFNFMWTQNFFSSSFYEFEFFEVVKTITRWLREPEKLPGWLCWAVGANCTQFPSELV